AIVMGVVSKSVGSAGISKQLSNELAKLGEGSVLKPAGYIGFAFIFFVLAGALFSCSQLAAARHEEAEGRLETLLALPLGRIQWLAGRLVLAVAGLAALGACAGVLAWAGAASQGVHISLAKLLEAGLNVMPTGVLFLG